MLTQLYAFPCPHGPQIPGKTLTISGCYFADNSVTEEDQESWGGAVVAVGGLVTVNSSMFTGNSGEGVGSRAG